MNKTTMLTAALLSAGFAANVQAGADNVTGIVVSYVPIYLNAASSGNGYIDTSKGPVQAKIDSATGIAMRNKGLAPVSGGGSDDRAHRMVFNFGTTLSGASNLTLRPSMTGVPAHSGTWRLVISKADGTSSNYACNFTDTSANCFDGTNRLIKLSGIAGAVAGYIEVEGMPDTSEIVVQSLRFTINDDGNANTTAANEYDLVVAYK